MPAALFAAVNIAPAPGRGILGCQAAIDGSTGNLVFHSGTAAAINDVNLFSRVDNFGVGGNQGISFVGIVWPSTRYEQVDSVVLTLAAFGDGGWFGPNGQNPPGGILTPAYLIEPTVQVSTNNGTNWTTVVATSDYLTALNGQTIGPPSALTSTFTLTPPVTAISGLRIIGPNGGSADGNGFIGVFELDIQANFADVDGDSMPDAWEVAHGLNPAVYDAAGDPDADGLVNYSEYLTGTDPQNPDCDGDGYSDGVEVMNGTDPNDPNSIPGNVARDPSATAILGTESAAGVDTPTANAGTPANINDGDLASHVDTWNGGNTDPKSYVGITWTSAPTNPVIRLELTLATFGDGGWFGPNNRSPVWGGLLDTTYLVEPDVQISTDGGFTWSNSPHVSDYFNVMNGHRIGGDPPYPNPSFATSTFILDPPATNILGIRIIGSEGGVASPGGFLGVAELKIYMKTDDDHDGMDDDWERKHGLVVGVNDAALDPDSDGLTNLQEFQRATDPHNPDTDGDSLNDGAEVNTYHTNPLSADTDQDGLKDGAEVNTYNTNPLVPDTDQDGFTDGLEVKYGSNPLSAASTPVNAAFRSDASGIIGTESAAGVDTPYGQAGSPANINDGDPATHVDTWNDTGTDPISYVGIQWTNPMTTPISRLRLILATFGDGGWFGPNNRSPVWGGLLDPTYLLEPKIQVFDGANWSDVQHQSDYLTVLNGHRIGGDAPLPNPSFATATFVLNTPAANIRGIRIIGSEGGVASAGFLGVAELSVLVKVDSDADGMDDNWETEHGLNVGVNDAALDPDSDGLSNLQEFLAATDPHNPDSDGDGLSDGSEVNNSHTNPRSADTDADGLSDSAELNLYKTNPLIADTDGDGYTDGQEVRWSSDPLNASSIPFALRSDAFPIMGTESPLGVDTPVANAAPVNDDNLNSSVNTWNDTGTDPISYVGILWGSTLTNPVGALELDLATFFDGGWFGTNNVGPGAGGSLSASTDLALPAVQVTFDGGITWSNVTFTSDYLTAMNGHPLPAVAFGYPTLGTSHFYLTPPVTNINGIRLIGQEGGTASGGFLGVFELGVLGPVAQPVTLLSPALVSGQFTFKFDSQAGTTYDVQFKSALTDPTWTHLTTITGDGSRKTVSDTAAPGAKFYRVLTQ